MKKLNSTPFSFLFLSASLLILCLLSFTLLWCGYSYAAPPSRSVQPSGLRNIQVTVDSTLENHNTILTDLTFAPALQIWPTITQTAIGQTHVLPLDQTPYPESIEQFDFSYAIAPARLQHEQTPQTNQLLQNYNISTCGPRKICLQMHLNAQHHITIAHVDTQGNFHIRTISAIHHVDTPNAYTFSFDRVPLQRLFEILSDASGIPIHASERIRGQITITTPQTPWPLLLDIITAHCQLEVRQTNNEIVILPGNNICANNLPPSPIPSISYAPT